MTKKTNRRIIMDLSQTYSVDAIKDSLTENLESVIYSLFPNHAIECRADQIRVGNKGSLAIDASGEWYSHEEQRGGDILSLIEWRLDCSFPEALRWAKGHKPDLRYDWDFPKKRLPKPNKKFCMEKSKNSRDYAWRLWGEGKSIWHTIAETYLENRGIVDISSAARRKMRFHPSVKHVPSGTWLPCLLFRLDKANGDFAGVLRVYLARNGRRKATVKSSKMLLGSASDAAIQFSKARDHLVITEGPEDALSIMQMHPYESVWCIIGSNLASFNPPPATKRITIAADNDKAGRAFADKLSRRLFNEGYEVYISLPRVGKDFNDVLRGGNDA